MNTGSSIRGVYEPKEMKVRGRRRAVSDSFKSQWRPSEQLALYPFFHFGSSMSSACTRLARWSPSPARTICRKQTTWCSVGGAILGFTNVPTSGLTAFTEKRDQWWSSGWFLWRIMFYSLCVSLTCVGKLSSEPPDLHHSFIPQAVLLTKLWSATSELTSPHGTCSHHETSKSQRSTNETCATHCSPMLCSTYPAWPWGPPAGATLLAQPITSSFGWVELDAGWVWSSHLRLRRVWGETDTSVKTHSNEKRQGHAPFKMVHQQKSLEHVSPPVEVFEELPDCHGCYYSDDIRQAVLLLTES